MLRDRGSTPGALPTPAPVVPVASSSRYAIMFSDSDSNVCYTHASMFSNSDSNVCYTHASMFSDSDSNVCYTNANMFSNSDSNVIYYFLASQHYVRK